MVVCVRKHNITTFDYKSYSNLAVLYKQKNHCYSEKSIQNLFCDWGESNPWPSHYQLETRLLLFILLRRSLFVILSPTWMIQLLSLFQERGSECWISEIEIPVWPQFGLVLGDPQDKTSIVSDYFSNLRNPSFLISTLPFVTPLQYTWKT